MSNCPSCAEKLNWPKEVSYAEDTYSPENSSSSATILLLLGTVLLSIVAIYLIANNSNPVDAISHTPNVATSDSIQANEMKVATQPDIQNSYQIIATSPTTQTSPAASYPDADVNSAEGSISYESPTITLMNPTSTTTTGTYVPKSSSYLDTLYPNWGRCSGGSCRSYYQP